MGYDTLSNMYDDDDLSVLDVADELESPLDNIEPLDASSEAEKPDPEAMLALLTARETPQQWPGDAMPDRSLRGSLLVRSRMLDITMLP